MISHKSGGVPGTFDHGERASSHEDYIMESEAKKCAFLDFFFFFHRSIMPGSVYDEIWMSI